MPTRTIDSIDELRSLVGQEIATSDWLEVTQAMIDTFAEVTGDHQWIHVDRERAKKESPFGTTIAHGFLTLSLITRLHGQSVDVRANKKMGINYGLNRLRFVSPVKSGAKIRSRSSVKAIDDFEGGVLVTWGILVEIEGGEKPALVAEWLGRIYV